MCIRDRLRFGQKPPPKEERSLNDTMITWLKSAKSIEEVSDGVNAFCGILTQMAAGDPEVLLIDEPEAFLHPALAFKLGKQIGLKSVSEDKQVFVSTHSPNFLLGAIQSGASVDVIRLTYSNEVSEIKALSAETIQRFMHDPLLRSSNVLSGIFHNSVCLLYTSPSPRDRG